MIFKNNNPYSVLREEAEDSKPNTSSTDVLDPEASESVADIVEDLEDTLEDVKEYGDEEETAADGGVPYTADMCTLVKQESTRMVRGRTKKSSKFYLEATLLWRFMEANDIEQTPDGVNDALDQIADANTTEVEDGEGDVVQIDKADIVIVGPSDDEVKEIVADAVQEAKLFKKKTKDGEEEFEGPGKKKAKDLLKKIENIKNSGVALVKKKKKTVDVAD